MTAGAVAQLIRVCDRAELPRGEMRKVEHAGRRILVANVDDDIVAVDGTCTHEEADLAMGFLSEGVVTCPLHLSQFDLRTGEVLTPPATVGLTRFKVKIQDSSIFVEIE